MIEASKVLSGWSITGYHQFLYRSNYHVKGPKTVLGVKIERATNGYMETFDLIDLLLKRPETGQYVGKKIWEYFVAPDPDAALVDEVAKLWRELGYDTGQLMSVLLRSNYFYSGRAMRKLVKNPMEYVVGAIRNTGMTPVRLYRSLANEVVAQGLPLMWYRSPEGAEDGLAWLDSVSLISRSNFADRFTQTRTTSNFRSVFDPNREIQRHNLRTAEEIVAHYLDLMVDSDVPPLVRTFLVEFMNRDDSGPVPFTRARANTKVRGLVHLIMSLPEYQMN